MNRIKQALIIVATTAIVALVLGACHLIGIAHAQAVAASNPVATSIGSTDAAWQLLVDYGPIMGGILVVYGIGRAFLARNDSKHWIAQGKTLSILTGAATVLGAVLEWKLNGGSPAGIIVALYAAINLVTHSTVSAAPPTPTTGPTIATASLLVLFCGVALSCTHDQRVAAGHAFWDCTAPDRAQVVDALTPLATSAILAAASADGKLIDDAKIKQTFSKANLLSDAGQLALCAASAGFAAVLAAATAKPAPGSPQAAGLEIDPLALHQAFDSLRAAQFPGVTVQTKQGAL